MWVKLSQRKEKLMLSLLGLIVPSLKISSISCCLRWVLVSVHCFKPQTMMSFTECSDELKCSAIGRPGDWMRIMRKCFGWMERASSFSLFTITIYMRPQLSAVNEPALSDAVVCISFHVLHWFFLSLTTVLLHIVLGSSCSLGYRRCKAVCFTAGCLEPYKPTLCGSYSWTYNDGGGGGRREPGVSTSHFPPFSPGSHIFLGGSHPLYFFCCKILCNLLWIFFLISPASCPPKNPISCHLFPTSCRFLSPPPLPPTS